MNAREEFLLQVENRGLVCAKLNLYRIESRGLVCAKLNLKHLVEIDDVFLLKQNYTESDLESFLKSIDFEYDNDLGGQELFGIIWHSETTWSERFVYDGAEKWDFKQIPPIPNELLL